MQRSSDWGNACGSALGVVLAALVCLPACASERGANEKRLQELRHELTQVQNVADRLEDRVSALELSTLSTATAAAQTPSPSAPVYRPRLKVVHVTPESPEPAAPQPENTNSERSTSDGR
ncbi:MAG TPA: hypothetical protein VK524_05820 [Polyangiaceae bacterium]|nr:hypothetical protein [Polyangiaceae bacterium]